MAPIVSSASEFCVAQLLEVPVTLVEAPSTPKARKKNKEQAHIQEQRARLLEECTLDDPLPDTFPPGKWTPRATQVFPRIWVADAYTASSPKTILALGITHMVSISSDGLVEFPLEHRFQLFRIFLPQNQCIEPYIYPTKKFLEEAYKDEKSTVMIQSPHGASRAVALAMAMIMPKVPWDYDELLAYFKSIRPISSPRENFEMELRDYEQTLGERKFISEELRATTPKVEFISYSNNDQGAMLRSLSSICKAQLPTEGTITQETQRIYYAELKEQSTLISDAGTESTESVDNTPHPSLEDIPHRPTCLVHGTICRQRSAVERAGNSHAFFSGMAGSCEFRSWEGFDVDML